MASFTARHTGGQLLPIRRMCLRHRGVISAPRRRHRNSTAARRSSVPPTMSHSRLPPPHLQSPTWRSTAAVPKPPCPPSSPSTRHRRAGRLGRHDHAGPSPGSRRRRRPHPARLGRAPPGGPRRLPAPRRRRAARRQRRHRRAAGPRAGQAARRGLHDGGAADDRRLHWCAKAGPKILADEKVRMTQACSRSARTPSFSYEPIGVVGVIAPWNYPWSIPFGEVAIALMAGNGVVLKPASLTPLLGEAIRRVFEKGGLPEGLLRVVHGGGAVGDALARSSVGKVFFTGSVEVGRKVGEACARATQGLGAGAGRQGPDDRLRRRRPRQRHLRRRLGGIRQCRPDLLRDRALSTSCARIATASSRVSRARRRSCGSATRWSGTPRSAR